MDHVALVKVFALAFAKLFLWKGFHLAITQEVSKQETVTIEVLFGIKGIERRSWLGREAIGQPVEWKSLINPRHMQQAANLQTCSNPVVYSNHFTELQHVRHWHQR